MAPFLDPDRLSEHRQRNLVHSVLLVSGISLLLAVSAWLIAGSIGALIALGSIALLAALGPRVRPETVMRLYRGRPVDPRHGAQLMRLLQILAERAELPQCPKLYVVPSSTLNAFASGSPSRAAIAVTEGLLRRLSLREIVGVLAHEMSHIRNNDVFVLGLADAMTRSAQMFAYLAVGLALVNIPALLLGLDTFSWIAIALLYLTPAASSVLQLGLSRTREFDADLEAAGLTGDPVGLAAALRSLERFEGRIWEDLLLPPTRRVPFPSLLRSHPDTSERIARLTEVSRHPLAHHIAVTDEPMISLAGLGPAEMAPRHRWPGLWY